jgi:hypothetical protein
MVKIQRDTRMSNVFATKTQRHKDTKIHQDSLVLCVT